MVRLALTIVLTPLALGCALYVLYWQQRRDEGYA